MTGRFHDGIWEAVPEDAPAPRDFGARAAFLRGHLRPGMRVLDLGCGDGRFLPVIAECGCEAVGADVSAKALERAARRAPGAPLHTIAEGDALPAEGLDLIWCSEVLEHVVDTAWLLAEAHRALRSDGLLLVTTPANGRLRTLLSRFETRFDPLGPDLRFYTRRSLGGALEDAGFADVRVRTPRGALHAHACRPGLRLRVS